MVNWVAVGNSTVFAGAGVAAITLAACPTAADHLARGLRRCVRRYAYACSRFPLADTFSNQVITRCPGVADVVNH